MPLTSTRRQAIGLLKAAHPEPGAAVTAGAALLAIITGRSAAGVVAVTLAIAASQFAGGWHNDWLDADRDRTAGRADKPIPAGEVSRRAVGIGAAVASVSTVALGLLSGPLAGAVATIGLLSVLSYNWRLKFTAASVLPYMISFAALPSFVVLGLPGAPWPPWWLVLAGALLGAGAHFANVLSDLDDDARTGVHGLPHRLGARGSTLAASTLLLATTGLLVFGPPGPSAGLGLAGFVVVAGVLSWGNYLQRRSPGSKSAFRAVIASALINVALLLTAGAVV